MSRYINGLVRKLEDQLRPYRESIVKTVADANNNSGYGYLSSGRKNTHHLSDGTHIEEGLVFDPAKAATIAYFNHRNADGEIITK